MAKSQILMKGKKSYLSREQEEQQEEQQEEED